MRHTPFRDSAKVLRVVSLVLITLGLIGSSEVTRLTAMRRGDARDIRDFITPLKDLETTVRVTKMDTKELEKIGGDFATNYTVFRNLRTMNLLYKSPDKLLLEGKSHLFGDAALLIVGPTRFYAVSKLKLRKRENLEKEPARRQSLLEYSGLLSADTLRYMRAKPVREEILAGSPTLVYDLTYQGGNGSYYRLWIDPKTHVIRKRTWYDGENKLRATFCYEESREVSDGIYVPGRCDILNADGVMAGSMTYSDTKVNQGVSDDLFDVAR